MSCTMRVQLVRGKILVNSEPSEVFGVRMCCATTRHAFFYHWKTFTFVTRIELAQVQSHTLTPLPHPPVVIEVSGHYIHMLSREYAQS